MLPTEYLWYPNLTFPGGDHLKENGEDRNSLVLLKKEKEEEESNYTSVVTSSVNTTR